MIRNRFVGQTGEGERKFMSEDSMLTRVTLIGKAKDQNDDRAWAEFTAYYRKYIYNLVRRIGLNHHDADEVVQITLMKIWNAMPEFQYKPEKGRFRSWICCIAGNAAKNFIRANIHVERDSQKPILIGKGGSMIAKLRERSQKRIEEFLGKKYRVELNVVVSPNWRNDTAKLEQFGYIQRDEQ